MENVMSGPPSSNGFTAGLDDETVRQNRSEVVGAVISMASAVLAVTLLVAWGQGMSAALDGFALVLYAAQVASGVVIALGFAVHAAACIAAGRSATSEPNGVNARGGAESP